MNIELHHIELILLPHRALFLPAYKVLCIADWHLGKAAHFRKSGIAMPQPLRDKGYGIIQNLIAEFDIDEIIFLGDLFHSSENNDWNLFREFILQSSGIGFVLIKGNHDIIAKEKFEEIGIKVKDEQVVDDRIIFTHHPLFENNLSTRLNIAGHIHPGYAVAQKGKQKFRLPAFYHSRQTLVLPAFGEFTGLQVVKEKQGDDFFCIAGDDIIKIRH